MLRDPPQIGSLPTSLGNAAVYYSNEFKRLTEPV
jgi:hypothetical protein